MKAAAKKKKDRAANFTVLENKPETEDTKEQPARFRDIAYKFVSYPVIIICAVLGYVLVINGFLPTINMVGHQTFSFEDQAYACYFLVPYTALNVFLLGGYFWLVRKMAQTVSRVTKQWFQAFFTRRENKKS